jgi:3',5'-cyclic AMP phosphodiesterase CpdA
MRLIHVSDVHFGKIAHPAIVESLLAEIAEIRPTLVAISGDLTQRARTREFKPAVEMIEAIKQPVLVVPGNHDVYPWWKPVGRMINPLARFKRHISSDLCPTYEEDGLSVLGINTAHGRTIKGGKITETVHKRVRDHFSTVDDGVFKVMVLHHHLTKIQALGSHDVARNAKRTLAEAGRQKVDLILCGHLHISHIEPIEIAPAGHKIVIASAGTATSNRGRESNRDTNFYNLIEISDEEFKIEERKFDLESHQFVVENGGTFTRENVRRERSRSS